MSVFRQVSKISTEKLKKRTSYSGDQYFDIDAKIVNGTDYSIKVTGSQRVWIDTSMNNECLRSLVKDLTALLVIGDESK